MRCTNSKAFDLVHRYYAMQCQGGCFFAAKIVGAISKLLRPQDCRRIAATKKMKEDAVRDVKIF